MQAFVIGADRLGSIPDLLSDYGISIACHVSGRHPAHQRKPDSAYGVDLIIVFTDFLSHNAMKHYRTLAKSGNIRFIASRRSISDLSGQLQGVVPARRAA